MLCMLRRVLGRADKSKSDEGKYCEVFWDQQANKMGGVNALKLSNALALLHFLSAEEDGGPQGRYFTQRKQNRKDRTIEIHGGTGQLACLFDLLSRRIGGMARLSLRCFRFSAPGVSIISSSFLHLTPNHRVLHSSHDFQRQLIVSFRYTTTVYRLKIILTRSYATMTSEPPTPRNSSGTMPLYMPFRPSFLRIDVKQCTEPL